MQQIFAHGGGVEAGGQGHLLVWLGLASVAVGFLAVWLVARYPKARFLILGLVIVFIISSVSFMTAQNQGSEEAEEPAEAYPTLHQPPQPAPPSADDRMVPAQ